MQKLTLKQCIEQTHELNIPIYGDVSFRGECKKEDPELSYGYQALKLKYPQYEHLFFHVVNEWKPTGSTSYAHYTKLLNKGMKPRLADFICLPVKHGAPAFLCEVKRLNIAESLKSKARKEHYLEQISLLSSQKQNGAVVCVALGGHNLVQAFTEYVEKYE